MKAFIIKDIKHFMNQLLVYSIFDHFNCIEASITTFNTFQITGRIHPDYYPLNEYEALEKPEYSNWAMLKPLCYEIIKGKKTPLNFSFILSLTDNVKCNLSQKGGISSSIFSHASLHLNIKFDHQKLSVISATSLDCFSMDKSLEQLWDSTVETFLKKHFDLDVFQ